MKEEALKLADDLEELHEQDLIDGVAHLSMPQASAMIRRLVEELDKQVKPIGVYDGKNVHIYTPQVKQGEPIAWMSPDGKVSQTEGRLFYIPLYTTPQTKPLSDEEILDMSDDYIANQFELAFTGEGLVEYVKAVMKKAGQR
jgi:hypothetical protein